MKLSYVLFLVCGLSATTALAKTWEDYQPMAVLSQIAATPPDFGRYFKEAKTALKITDCRARVDQFRTECQIENAFVHCERRFYVETAGTRAH